MASSEPGATCGTVIEYSAEQQRQAADELVAMPHGIVRDVMIPDYGAMRDEARACRGEKP